MRAKSRILVTAARGTTPYLKEELFRLGFPVLSETPSSIETEGTPDDTLRMNLMLRTAQRVLYLLDEFDVKDADGLYRAMSGLPWEDYIDADGYLSVTSTVDNPTIKDSRFVNVKAKDAIVDRIRQRRGQRPDSGPDRDRTVVHVRWKDERCSVYFDTSGETLSRRGYRKIPLTAPMQETLAAAVILATGWNGRGHFINPHFINPMCGSGTLAIEAALIGLDKAPGLLRSNFGFMHIKGFSRKSIWEGLREEARKRAKNKLDCRIIATDIDKKAVEAAKNNAGAAGVAHLIEFAVCDYAETDIPAPAGPEGNGIVILNPEYGERMGKLEELEGVYKGIGDFFKKKCMGYTGYIFTGNPGLAKKIGLRAKRRIPFFNGPIECRLLEYELYEGSRK